MLIIKLTLVVIALVSIAFLLMGFNIFLRKKQFPKFEVGHNPDMRKMGLTCAKYDEIKAHKMRKKGKCSQPNTSCGC